MPVSQTRDGSRISAPVDLFYPEERILVRELAGIADLTERNCQATDFDRDAELASYRAAVAREELPVLTILKARSCNGSSPARPLDRGKAKFDVALGKDANFVLLDVEGEWVTDGPEVHIEEAATRMRARLERFAWEKPHVCVPSLRYASGEHPRAVQIEVTTRCNLHCGYCNHRRLSAKRHTRLEEIARILEKIDFTQVTHVDLTGLGEPLLHPSLPNIIAAIRQRGEPQSISVVTNGTVATVDRCRRLLEAGLTSISVSLDSLDPIQFSASRAGASLDIVKRNVIELARFRRLNVGARFELQLKPVLLAENPYDEANRILIFSAEHGLDKPRFATLDRRRVATARYEKHLQVREWATQSADTISRWVNRRWTELKGTKLNEETARPDEQSLPWVHRRLRQDLDVCDWVIEAVYVGGDGFCIPCCQQMGDLPRPRIASIFNKPLSRLWNDELLYAYRLPLSLGLIPARCQGCNHAPRQGQLL